MQIMFSFSQKCPPTPCIAVSEAKLFFSKGLFFLCPILPHSPDFDPSVGTITHAWSEPSPPGSVGPIREGNKT